MTCKIWFERVRVAASLFWARVGWSLVLLLGLFAADSYDDLVKTHSRYFRTPGKIVADIEPLKL